MAGAQRLLRKICPDCKEPYQPDQKTLKLLEIEKTPTGGFVHGKGCNYCYGTGFRGREGVFEVLEINSDIQSAITAGKTAMEIKKMAVDKGMKTMRDLAIIKVLEGKTTPDEVKRVIALVPERF